MGEPAAAGGGKGGGARARVPAGVRYGEGRGSR